MHYEPLFPFPLMLVCIVASIVLTLIGIIRTQITGTPKEGWFWAMVVCISPVIIAILRDIILL